MTLISKQLLLGSVLFAGLSGAAFANDSTAELAAGGLVFVSNLDVSMLSEDLFISDQEVRVKYVYKNNGTEDSKVTVAFPMPEIVGNPFIPVSIPEQQSDNFMDFKVEVNGQPVETKLQQRANVAGIDITDELLAAGIPLQPFSEAAYLAVEQLPPETQQEWIRRGILVNDEYDNGEGMKAHYSPYWALNTVYYWDMNFPAGEELKVSHSYKPSVGGTVGMTFMYDGKFEGDTYDEYENKYCFDEGLLKSIKKAQAEAKGTDYEYYPYFEKRISYILKTAQNWGVGQIADFHLTIDKGKADSLVSFCGANVEKTGPTTFEIRAKDFYPESDLDILILEKPGSE